MWRSVVFATTVLLSSCALFPEAAHTNDVVRDESAAIAIAQKLCNGKLNIDPADGHWYAVLHDGIWDAGFHFSHSPYRCDPYEVRIFASNGKSEDCDVCVVTD